MYRGGEEVLLDVGGQDSTEAFEDVGHSDEAREILDGLLVGNLKRQVRHPPLLNPAHITRFPLPPFTYTQQIPTTYHTYVSRAPRCRAQKPVLGSRNFFGTIPPTMHGNETTRSPYPQNRTTILTRDIGGRPKAQELRATRYNRYHHRRRIDWCRSLRYHPAWRCSCIRCLHYDEQAVF